ncbi:MAG: hypothetical protein IPJ41_13795 [Phycisphaerales bacterium]|nr:hypothetical protein [Phycisphaerales bacterium]
MHTRGKIAMTVLAGLLGTAWAASPTHRSPGAELVADQPADLPAAETLFEAYIEAIGGRANLAKQTNRVLHGIYRVASSGMCRS